MEKYKVREGCVIRSSLLLTFGIISQPMRRADCPLHVHLREIQVIYTCMHVMRIIGASEAGAGNAGFRVPSRMQADTRPQVCAQEGIPHFCTLRRCDCEWEKGEGHIVHRSIIMCVCRWSAAMRWKQARHSKRYQLSHHCLLSC